jgi:hypothetical protein
MSLVPCLYRFVAKKLFLVGAHLLGRPPGADTWVRPYKKYPFESNSALTVKNRKPTTLNRKLSSLHHHILTTFDFQEVDPVGAGPHHVVLLAKGELAGDAVEVFHSI